MSGSFFFFLILIAFAISHTGEDMDNDLVVVRNRKKHLFASEEVLLWHLFSSIPFLRSIEGKHKVGEFVCVTGKVKLLVFIIFGCFFDVCGLIDIGLSCFHTPLLLK